MARQWHCGREANLAESGVRTGEHGETGRTASCFYCAEEVEHPLTLELSGIRAKIAAEGTEGV